MMTDVYSKPVLRIDARRAICVLISRHVVGELGLLAMAEAAFSPDAIVHSKMSVRGRPFLVTSKVTADQIDIELLGTNPLRLVRCVLAKVAPRQWRLCTTVNREQPAFAWAWFSPDEQRALVEIVPADTDFQPAEDDGVMMLMDIVISKNMTLRERLDMAYAEGGQHG